MITMQQMRENAREKLKGWCRVCLVCDGRVCAGEVPGMGGAGRGESFQENVRALGAWKLNMRTLHDLDPSPGGSMNLSTDFFGQKLSIPVMGAPIAGTAYNLGNALSEEGLAQALHAGCHNAGVLSWSGDGAGPEMFEIGLQTITVHDGRGVPTIKPRPVEAIIDRIRRAEDAGVPAVAIDVDAAGFQAMTQSGQPVGPLPAATISELVSATQLPLILKGIMTPDEAVLAASLGVAGIVVSNHGGRIMDSCPGTAEVLPAISATVRGRMKVFIDGGIRRGIDVLKALALGADAVLVGRPLIMAAVGGGEEGVSLLLRSWRNELSSAMILTGVRDVNEVSPTILYKSSV